MPRVHVSSLAESGGSQSLLRGAASATAGASKTAEGRTHLDAIAHNAAMSVRIYARTVMLDAFCHQKFCLH